MARINVPTQNQVAPGQVPGAQAAAPRVDAGAVAAEQIGRLGQTVGQAADTAARIGLDVLERQNEARVNEALTQAQVLAVQQQNDYQRLKGADALPQALGGVPLAERVARDYTQSLADVGRSLNLNPVQMQRFRERATPMANNLRTGAMAYERQQADVYEEQVYTSSVAANQEAALSLWQNPEALALSLDQIRTVTRDRARSKGMPPEAAAMAVRENVGKALLGVVAANADTDPIAMRDFLEENGGSMLPSQLEAARNQVNPGVSAIVARSWVAGQRGGVQPLAGEAGASVVPPLQGQTEQVVDPVEGGTPTSGYGRRARFRTANGAWSSSNHDGMDVAAPEGTPVRAVASGTVVAAGTNGGYGTWVEIEHGDGVRTGYAHLQGFNVKVGDVVGPGQTIGAVGSTGNSTGPHLHLRARRDGVSFDPAELLGAGTIRRAATPGDPQTAPVSQPTRAELIRRAREEFGGNPVMLAAATSEINAAYALDEAEQQERRENALTTAYRHIEATGTMPTGAMLADIQRNAPGSLGTVTNYFETMTAPPARKDDEALNLALITNPDAWRGMTPEQFVARYGQQLTPATLRSYVGDLVAATDKQRKDAAAADIVPSEAFGRAFRDVTGLAGIDTTPKREDERQDMARVQESARQRVLARQAAEGRQLTEPEIRAEVSAFVGNLQWERRGLFGGESRGFAASYRQMQVGDQSYYRERLRAAGTRSPTPDQIYLAYLRDRITR